MTLQFLPDRKSLSICSVRYGVAEVITELNAYFPLYSILYTAYGTTDDNSF